MRKLFLVICLLAIVPLASVARNGAWFDEVVFFEEADQSKVVAMMETGDAHFFGNIFDATQKAGVEAAGLPYVLSYGNFNELLLNQVGPYFNNGSWNPFYVPEVRQAFQILTDRDYIVDEIILGLGAVRYTCITPLGPIFSEIPATMRGIEIQYAYDFEKGKKMFEDAMIANGATLEADGWHHANEAGEDELLVLIGIIRNEDERKDLGDYHADVFESVGFAPVDRQYKPASEAHPIWLFGSPWTGDWHYYTGGWIANQIDREATIVHEQYYTDRIMPYQLCTDGWGPAIDPEHDAASAAIATGDYADMAERAQLLATCEEKAAEAAYHVWLYTQAGLWGHPANVDAAYDLAAGIMGSVWWARTARFVDDEGAPVEGGTLRIAEPSFLTDVWNPIAGSNWLYDAQIQRGTQEQLTLPHPHTGLDLPNWFEFGELTVVNAGLPPIRQDPSSTWLTFNEVDSVAVDADAWYDWDAAAQEWITVGEAYPGGLTANSKITWIFPEDLFSRKWHDGSNFSIGDILMKLIYGFDSAKPESRYYDEVNVPAFDQFMTVFKGIKIVSMDPLTITRWDDQVYLDAEASFANKCTVWWPGSWAYGVAPWHVLAPALELEATKTAVFSADLAVTLGVDQQNWIAGPTLELLKNKVEEVAQMNTLPYETVLLSYMDPGEIFDRYQSLLAWLEAKGHVWIGLGPMYLDSVDTTAKIVVAKRFEDYPFDSNRWLIFAAPKLAELEITGPDTVTAGETATFDLALTFEGEPYPADEITKVVYLVVDATGALVQDGLAEVTGDGTAVATIDTTGLTEGSTILEIAVVVGPAAVPTKGNFSFIVAQ